ncbi:PTS sugar transporter subunit IIA [Paratissierella segnis]|jgi:mannose/fructose/sorbose-specific phosphotransferase system IIA component|uniref:PTS sugar transporter subunit IIA n=1 Tax=Paratissierella segnis TaxID=2763679 RepID=A0A926IF18_9FIRM|nr:PTS sugar transporter subunit IIA [Paratissierella segnis]MBC8588012.1 PTS sugar transporter subunit IIA [Paratissierella segnis]
MVGIVLISHGKMAQGMLDSAKVLFGELAQVVSVELNVDDSPEDFRIKLSNAIKKVDIGDGAVVLADLYGGTPSNQAAYIACNNVQVISGMNLTIFLELLSMRLNDLVEVEKLVEYGKNGIVHINKILGIE